MSESKNSKRSSEHNESDDQDAHLQEHIQHTNNINEILLKMQTLIKEQQFELPNFYKIHKELLLATGKIPTAESQSLDSHEQAEKEMIEKEETCEFFLDALCYKLERLAYLEESQCNDNIQHKAHLW